MLYPGAGGGRDARTLVVAERSLAPFPVRREEFANRSAGKKGPERQAAAVEHIRGTTAQLATDLGVPTSRIAVGGRSFGGRMASVAVAQGLEVGALVLLSYPLHPPGKPDQLRIDHLADIGIPTLAISGEKDPFGSPDELTEHLAAISDLTLRFVPGPHAPADGPVLEIVRDWLGLGDA